MSELEDRLVICGAGEVETRDAAKRGLMIRLYEGKHDIGPPSLHHLIGHSEVPPTVAFINKTNAIKICSGIVVLMMKLPS